MGIRTKIFAGFSVVALLLFISGLIAIYELTSVGSSMKGLLKDNLKSIDVSLKMHEATRKTGDGILLILNGYKANGISLIDSAKKEFKSSFTFASNNVTVKGENILINKVDSCYKAFEISVDSIVNSNVPYNVSWYTQVFLGKKKNLNEAIDAIVVINQRSLYQNAEQMELGTNRAIIPGLIAIGVGILFIVLFNYYISLYFIQPILRITQGVENYLKHSIPFRVKVDTKDEVEKLRSSVEKLIAQNKTNNPAE